MITTIVRTALVPYTQHQMFELVNAVEDYPRFLPWCAASHILKRAGNSVEATLDITWSGFHKSFTTRNILFPSDKINIELVEGPFKHLAGHWHFIPLGNEGCKVEMELTFELTGGILDKIFQPIFKSIANELVEKFCQRAQEIYGNR